MAVPCRLLRGLLRVGGFTGAPGLVGPWRSRCYTRVAGPEEAEEGGREGDMGREGEEGASLRVSPPKLPRGKWGGVPMGQELYPGVSEGGCLMLPLLGTGSGVLSPPPLWARIREIVTQGKLGGVSCSPFWGQDQWGNCVLGCPG